MRAALAVWASPIGLPQATVGGECHFVGRPLFDTAFRPQPPRSLGWPAAADAVKVRASRETLSLTRGGGDVVHLPPVRFDCQINHQVPGSVFTVGKKRKKESIYYYYNTTI